MDPNQYPNLNMYTPRPKSHVGRFVLMMLGGFVGILIVVLCLVYYFLFSAPLSGEYPVSLTVAPGSTLHFISTDAEKSNIIRSKTAFQTMMYLLGSDTKIQAGTYIFEKPSTVLDVALKISRGDRDITSLRITIPEGFTREEIATLFESKLKQFNEKDFLEKTKDKEGYLFPETYFFFEDATTDDVVNQLTSQFKKKTQDLDLHGKSLDEIVVMASLIEKEAYGDDDRKLISGILWKRLSIQMPLQVDATFKYILGKESSELTQDDLKINSPYNTYKNRGLPPTPISNPGLKSIQAALEPEVSKYLYYLHDSKGNAYFASTFEEHKKNKSLYLK